MPIRFNTVAANADRMNPEGEAPTDPGARGTARSRYDRPLLRPSKAPGDKADAGTPGKDINAAGFLRDASANPSLKPSPKNPVSPD